MHLTGGTSVAYRCEIESAGDSDAKRREIEDRLHALTSPFWTAGATGLDVIGPAQTRLLIRRFVEQVQRILEVRLSSPASPDRPGPGPSTGGARS